MHGMYDRLLYIVENKVIWEHPSCIQTHSYIAVAHNRSTVFARWRQCARPHHTTFLGSMHSTHHFKRQLYRFIGFARVAPPIFPNICPFLWGSGPHLIYSFLGQPDRPPQTADLGPVNCFPKYTVITDGRIDRQNDNATKLNRPLTSCDADIE